MDIKEKIIKALSRALQPEYVRLENNDGISGFVVSRIFEGISALERQKMIEEALGSDSLTKREQRQVLMIAGVTPAEYQAVGARIRIHKVKAMAGGVVEILLHGGLSDAEYVRRTLHHQKGVQTTEPKQSAGARGVLMSFRGKGSAAIPLTKERAIQVLKKDRYIEVLSNV